MSGPVEGPWPTAADYVAAVQDAPDTLHHPALSGLRTRPGLMGLPAAATGQNAVVFDADAPSGRTALRCFTSVPARGAEPYRMLEAMDLADVLVPVRWCDDAIEVHGRRWPVVTMPWIVGDPLQRWIGDHLHLPTRIAALADAWAEACRLLIACGVAHGDLQHGNVLVTPEGALRIIDFDGVLLFDPTTGAHLTGAPAEVGHPSYQHPQRIEDGHVSRYVDTFSALLVHTTLRALVTDPGLWAHHVGENLVLAQRDLLEPDASDALARMRVSDDPVVARGADLLTRWCRTGVAANLTLADVLGARGAGAAGATLGAPGYRSRAAEREVTARAADPVSDWEGPADAPAAPTTPHAQYRADDRSVPAPPTPMGIGTGAVAGAGEAPPGPVVADDGTLVRRPGDVGSGPWAARERTLRGVVLPVVLGLTAGALLLVVATFGGVAARFLPDGDAELPRPLEVGSCFLLDGGGRVLPERCTAVNDGRVIAEVADVEWCELLGGGERVPFAVVDGRTYCLEDRVR